MPKKNLVDETFHTHTYTTVHVHPHSPITHRIYLQHPDQPPLEFTPIVDAIPLYNSEDNTYNMVCEIPRFTRAKMEIEWKLPYQPIKQDLTADGRPREYQLSPMPFNYGALPQTWEDPNHQCEHTGHNGDDDPLDVIDIGHATASTGLVYRVKVLGVLGMIDQNETDWKIIAINANDPMATYIHDICDVDKHRAGVLDTLKEWLRMYKVPEGKAPNRFAFNENYQKNTFAKYIISQMHHAWKTTFTTTATTHQLHSHTPTRATNKARSRL